MITFKEFLEQFQIGPIPVKKVPKPGNKSAQGGANNKSFSNVNRKPARPGRVTPVKIGLGNTKINSWGTSIEPPKNPRMVI